MGHHDDFQPGFYGIGVYMPKFPCNLGTLFRSAHHFGASFIFTIGHRYRKDVRRGDIPKSWRHIPLHHYEDLKTFNISRPQNATLVMVEITPGARPIETFKHPERAIYLLGGEDITLPPHIIRKANNVISINSSGSLNLAVAGSIVMYDRMAKNFSKTP